MKQPLSKGFLSAFQASKMYQIISAHSLSYQKIQYFDMFYLSIFISQHYQLKNELVKTLGQLGCSDLSVENPYFFPRLLVRYTKAWSSSLYLALCKIRVAEFIQVYLFYPRNPGIPWRKLGRIRKRFYPRLENPLKDGST